MGPIFNPVIKTDCCVDLSHSNAIHGDLVTAFQTAKASGVELIIQKATQGTTFVDPTFSARRAAAAQAGLLFGAYHFCDGSDPTSQMAHFLAVVDDPTGILLALDAEKNASQVTVDQIKVMVQAIRAKTGRLPLLYMGASGPDGSGMVANTIISFCDLWLPEYGNTPRCPPGWSEWTLHQYTGDGINGSGAVAGIGTGLDRSFFAGSIPELHAWFSKAVGTAPAAPTQSPAPTAPTAPPQGAPLPTISVQNKAETLKMWQRMLGVVDDGTWGPITEQAFSDFFS